MAELADALVSGTSGREVVQVQVLFSAPSRTASTVLNRRCSFLFYSEVFVAPQSEPPQSGDSPHNGAFPSAELPNRPTLPVAVRALAEAIHRQGGLGGPVYASVSGAEGTRLHQKLINRYRKRLGTDAVESEISLSQTVEQAQLILQVNGRCDLVLEPSGQICLYEIKSYSGSPSSLPPDGEPVHWAQAKLYGHLLASTRNLEQLTVGLLYISADHDALVECQRVFSAADLADFFIATVKTFSQLALRIVGSQRLRDQSARQCTFPFASLRPGQKRLMNDVIGIARQRGVLFAQAPTGTGKTLSVLFPAVRLLAHHLVDKVFYLTAMTSTRQVAEHALDDLRRNGLILRSITLQAKEKSCLCPDLFCETQKCPLALNYYRNLPAALEALFATAGHCSPANIAEAASRHQVCPFELSLDYALYCDVIIGDYNYAFDPRIQLSRFFALPDQHHLLLVDEAHNLVDRSREMYSADLDFAVVTAAALALAKQRPQLDQALQALVSYGERLKQNLVPPEPSSSQETTEAKGFAAVEAAGSGRQMQGDRFAAQTEKPQSLLRLLGRLIFLLRQFLDDQPEFPERSKVLDLFLMAHFFAKVADQFYGPAYITTASLSKTSSGRGKTKPKDLPTETLSLRLMCLDAAKPLTEIYLHRHPVIFFSATLAPLPYYTGLLLASGRDQAAEQLVLPSPFPVDHLKVLIESRWSTRFQERSATIQPILEQILLAASSRTGNYLVFLPSYGYLQQVRQLLRVHPRRQDFDFVVQVPGMDEALKQQFLSRFEAFGQKTLIGLAVMGSLFNEGIDLTGERLSGVMIVGVGLPQISPEREIMSQYFAGKLGRGFEFAYQYPGFNKVQQAAGRVIRSEVDVGFVLLLDDRYQKPDYQQLFPAEWQPVYLSDERTLADELSEFWSLHRS